MERLDVLLRNRFLRHEPHVRLAECDANRFRVIPVVLLAPHERLHVLRRNDPDLVPERFEPALPEEGAGAGLDSDPAGP